VSAFCWYWSRPLFLRNAAADSAVADFKVAVDFEGAADFEAAVDFMAVRVDSGEEASARECGQASDSITRADFSGRRSGVADSSEDSEDTELDWDSVTV